MEHPGRPTTQQLTNSNRSRVGEIAGCISTLNVVSGVEHRTFLEYALLFQLARNRTEKKSPAPRISSRLLQEVSAMKGNGR